MNLHLEKAPINSYMVFQIIFGISTMPEAQSLISLPDEQNFGLVQVNPFPNKPWFLCVCSTMLLKTLWEKKKLLITNNFSFSHSVFYSFGELTAIFIKFEIVICKLIQFGEVWNLSFEKGLSTFTDKGFFLWVWKIHICVTMVITNKVCNKETNL